MNWYWILKCRPPYAAPSQTAEACWVPWRLDVPSLPQTEKMVGGSTEALLSICIRASVFFPAKDGGIERMKKQGLELGKGVQFADTVYGRHWGVSLGPQSNALWEHNGWFRAPPVRLPSSPALLTGPGSASFCSKDICRAPFVSACLLIGLACLRKRHEYWLFHKEPGMLSAPRIVYWGTGRIKSTKRNRSQQRLWKCQSLKQIQVSINITNSNRILTSLVPPQSTCFCSQVLISNWARMGSVVSAFP